MQKIKSLVIYNMPILFQINVVANSGSTGRIVEGIAEKVMESGWECYTAFGRWANVSKTHLYRIGNIWEIYSHYLQSRLLDSHGLGSKNATRALIAQIDIIKPDLIHLHNLHGYYINYPILFNFLSKLSIPIVWTLHDCWAYTGHCVHYTSVNCSKWKVECFNCPNLLDYPSSLFCDNSNRNFNLKKDAFNSIEKLTIVTVSKWLAGEVKQSFLKKYPVRVIHNGVDVVTFAPVQTQIKLKYGIKDKFVILGVATVWNQRKGLADFIELSKYLLYDEIILLVGLNSRQIADLPDNIIGIKNTENMHELVELYSCADLFVNFSVEETFGLTTAESLACGTPVLVYNSTACSEIVTKEIGFIIAPHDIKEASEVVKRIKTIGKKNYTAACRSYAFKNFKKEEKYKEYVDLYNELL